MQVAVACSSRLLGRFLVIAHLQASLVSLCAWWSPRSTASAAAAFCMGGILGTFPDHVASGAYWSKKLGPVVADQSSQGRRKTNKQTHVSQHITFLKTWPRNPCAMERLAFSSMWANVCHFCYLPKVFDPLPAEILWKGVEVSWPRTGTQASEFEVGHWPLLRLVDLHCTRGFWPFQPCIASVSASSSWVRSCSVARATMLVYLHLPWAASPCCTCFNLPPGHFSLSPAFSWQEEDSFPCQIGSPCSPVILSEPPCYIMIIIIVIIAILVCLNASIRFSKQKNRSLLIYN